MNSVQACIFRLPEDAEARLRAVFNICGIDLGEKHRHGNGPLHSEVPVSPGFVAEVYPKSKKFSFFVSVITVPDLEKVKAKLKESDIPFTDEDTYLLVEITENIFQIQIWKKEIWDSFK